MNLTWHIVKKDLRALKWPLALWLLCIVAKLGIGVLLLTGDGSEGPEWFSRMDALSKVLGAFQFITFVLTAAVIHQDLLVGTTAFWITRPISGGRLLRAKLITIGLVFGLAPVLVNLPWWIGCHYGLDEVAWAAGETFAVQAIVVLIGLLWSVVTDGFARFLMWTLVTLFATPMVIAIITNLLTRRHSSVFEETLATRFLLILLLAVTGILVVTVHQFLTRRTPRSISIIAVFFGLIVLTGALWPWSFDVDTRLSSYLIRRAQGDWPTSTEPAGLKFAPTSAEFSGRRDRPDRPAAFITKYRVDGLLAGQGLMPVMSEHAWRWPNGADAKGRSLGRSALAESMAAQALNVSVTGTPGAAGILTFTGAVPASTMGRIRGEAPAYSLSARFRLMRFVSADRVPLQPGPWTRTEVGGERIAAVEKDGARHLVTFIEHRPSLWIDNVGGGQIAARGDYSQYYLVNRVTKFLDRGANTDIKSTRIGTVSIIWRTSAYTAAAATPLLAAMNALDDAELIKVTYAEQARFSHELTLSATEVAKANP
jgi:hypothetical protein